MLAHDPRVHRARMHAADRGKLPSKPPGVERCAGADHIDRASRPAPREVLRENVERTCRHQTDARKSTHLDMLRRPPRRWRDSRVPSRGASDRRPYDYRTPLRAHPRVRQPSGVARESRTARAWGNAWLDREPPLGVTLGSVINRQSRDESVTDDCPRTRPANAACADNPNSRHDMRTIQTHLRSHRTNRSAPLRGEPVRRQNRVCRPWPCTPRNRPETST